MCMHACVCTNVQCVHTYTHIMYMCTYLHRSLIVVININFHNRETPIIVETHKFQILLCDLSAIGITVVLRTQACGTG